MNAFPESALQAEIGVGPIGDRFEDVAAIAVLRGGGLGDLLFAIPAMRALRAAYPEARLTVLGTPMHRTLLEGRSEVCDAVEVLPPTRGVREVAGAGEDPEALRRFFDRMRAERYDLAVQLHGGGRFSNPFLSALGARHTVGSRTEDAAALERTIPYIYYQHEVLRALEVVGLAGARPVILEPQLTPTDGERALAGRHAVADDSPLLVVHPGATDPRRRWPPDRFATVAARAAKDGTRVIVVGDAGDAPAATRIVDAAAAAGAPAGRVISLAGALSLNELVAVLLNAAVMLGNDSGPRHLAQALGVPTVGVFWFGNVINAGPFGRSRHRVHLSWTTHCPVCGRDATQVGWTAERCEHDESFVDGVRPDAVYDDVTAVMARTAPPSGR